MKILIALFFAIPLSVAAQAPQVPHKMQFADMTLTIRDDARREIQKDVDALTQSPRHHNIKVERAKTYFPIIEKVFEEERVPDDFKYLVLQESALIADAVSVSNAVGFWQFKDFTAIEMGLRVDKDIDERKNIVSSSRAAARYIKKNNFYFNNWLYALQAYQMGAGGVMKSEKESEHGARHMEITSKTYWYVKKYLAHKVAFQDVVKGAGQLQVKAYDSNNQKSLAQLAKEIAMDEAELVSFNKWTKSGTIPSDRSYAIIIPVKGDATAINLPPVTGSVAIADSKAGKASESLSLKQQGERKKINGIAVIQAKAAETPTQLADRAKVDLSAFLKWNDISISDRLQPGQYYLLGKKRARGDQAYHTVAAGDNLWRISQQYGVQQKKLKRYNRIDSDGDINPGMTLWLASTKPKESNSTGPVASAVEVDDSQVFSWSVNPSEAQAAVSEKPVIELPKSALPVAIDTVEKPVVEAVDSTKTLQPATPPVLPADSVTKPVMEVVIVPKKSMHTVQAGETLYGIAKQYEVGVMDLVNWNGLSLQEGIKPGQILKVSENQPVENTAVETPKKPEEVRHEVKATDTLYSIARKYNVTIKELMEWNNKKDFNLTVGEKLKVMAK